MYVLPTRSPVAHPHHLTIPLLPSICISSLIPPTPLSPSPLYAPSPPIPPPPGPNSPPPSSLPKVPLSQISPFPPPIAYCPPLPPSLIAHRLLPPPSPPGSTFSMLPLAPSVLPLESQNRIKDNAETADERIPSLKIYANAHPDSLLQLRCTSLTRPNENPELSGRSKRIGA